MSKLIGTAPNQVPTNADLGTAAFVDVTTLVTAKGNTNLDSTGVIFAAPSSDAIVTIRSDYTAGSDADAVLILDANTGGEAEIDFAYKGANRGAIQWREADNQLRIDMPIGDVDIWTGGGSSLKIPASGNIEVYGDVKYNQGTSLTTALAGKVGTSGPQTITANSTSPALTITQDGTGNALEVRDVTGDTTPFVVDAGGMVRIATTTNQSGSRLNVLNGISVANEGVGSPLVQFFNGNSAVDNRYLRINANGGGGLALEKVNDAYNTSTELFNIGLNGTTTLGGSTSAPNFKVVATAGALDYCQTSGHAAGFPNIIAQGSSASVTPVISAKGAAGIAFCTGLTAYQQFSIGNTPSAVNFAQTQGSTTGLSVAGLVAVGSDTNTNLAISSKGGGNIGLHTNNYGNVGFVVNHIPSSVNYLSTSPSASPYPVLFPNGASANTALILQSKGTESIFLQTASGAATQFAAYHVPSAVNYTYVTGGSTGNRTTYNAAGSDTNVGFLHSAKGNEYHVFNAAGATQFVIGPVANAVNCVYTWGSVTGVSTSIVADGADANVSLRLSTKGAGVVYTDRVFQVNKATRYTSTVVTTNFDLTVGDFFTKTISGATTFTVSNVPAAGTVASFILDLTNGGSSAITWWTGVRWAGGTAPTLTAAGRDTLGFFTLDGGTTWSGLILGKDIK